MLDVYIKGEKARVLIMVVFPLIDSFLCFQMFRRPS